VTSLRLQGYYLLCRTFPEYFDFPGHFLLFDPMTARSERPHNTTCATPVSYHTHEVWPLPRSLATTAVAHTTVYAVWVNEVDQGLGCGQLASGKQTGESVYIRCPPNNNPVKDLSSSAMACNVNNVEAPKWISVKSGDKFTFEWHHDSRSTGDDIIASSHKGPVLVYIAPAASNGAGNVWVKLWQDAGTTSNWGVDKLIGAKGKHYITIPNLTPGKYLLRPELITLHEADTAYTSNSARGAQLYMECIQIEITSSGTTSLPAGVSFPGAYSYGPGIIYNLYGSNAAYTIPGPAPWSDYTGAAGYGGSGSVTLPPGGGTPSTTAGGSTPTGGTGTGGTVNKYGQCGGVNYSGPTSCVSSTCQKINDYYYQCL